jgi:alpha-beta hydrolase superfamily lysophospholipase
MRQKSARAFIAFVAFVAMALGALIAQPTTAGAQTGEFRKGPDPTATNITQNGTFATTTATVSSAVAGFGGGTITYPTSTTSGTFGAIAFAPGFTASNASYTWVGPRIASHGFVVFTINTDSRFDFPASRATQLQNALNYLVNNSVAASRIDRTRLAVGGHSMGGGGSLIAADNNANLQAAVPLQPWNQGTNFSGVNVPTAIVGAQNDTIASVSAHSLPFYNSIPAASEKALVVVAGASHGLGTTLNTIQARTMLVWLKRYVDNDTRFDPFVCPLVTSGASDYRNTCPP